MYFELYLFYNKTSPLCVLLGHLLHLNSLCEFFTKGQVCLKRELWIRLELIQKTVTLLKILEAASYQWYVIQDESEGGSSFHKILTDLARHELSLGDELPGIKPSL